MATPDPSSVDLSTYSAKDLIVAYTSIKTAVEAHEAKLKRSVARQKEMLDLLQAELLARMNREGTDSLKAAGHGTAFVKKITVPSVSNWNALYDHVASEIRSGTPAADVLAAFQRRITSDFVTDYQLRHDNRLPPGVIVNTERTVQIRRINTKDES